jgi:SAM-dependent methyltransferase
MIGNVRSRLGVIDQIWRAIGSQLRNPTGAAGSIVGWLMALVNDEPNRLAIDALDLGPGERVLELGFGPGWSLRTIAARTRGARVYGVDRSARMLEQARRMNEVAVSSGRMVLVQGPFSPLPWIDEMFDKVLLVNVVYFFDFDGRDISEVYRVLRSGGRLVIYVTSRDTMRKWPFAGPDTHRTFDAHDLANLLEDAGFRPSDIKISGAKLALGVKGLIAVAEKSGGSIPDDKIAQGRARCSIIRQTFPTGKRGTETNNPSTTGLVTTEIRQHSEI